MPRKKTEEIDISEAARIMGRKGGKVGGKSKSPAKQDAAIENGKRGGRPRVDNPVRKRPYHKKED